MEVSSGPGLSGLRHETPTANIWSNGHQRFVSVLGITNVDVGWTMKRCQESSSILMETPENKLCSYNMKEILSSTNLITTQALNAITLVVLLALQKSKSKMLLISAW